MAIWSAEIKELEKLYESLKGQVPDLEKELARLVKADDENMILLYSRRCLEVIITDLCECELKRDRGSEPLKGLIDKLHKEKKIPANIIASIHSLNELSTFGTHPKDFDPEQVKPVLVNLNIIIKWYLKYRESKINIAIKSQEVKDEVLISSDTAEKIQKTKKRLLLLLSGLTLVVAIVVVVLFVFNIIGGGIKELEKSIAVLPFKNDSPDEGKMYFINGTMEAILDNLCKIKDLRVPGRTSVEQYRDNLKPIPTIAKELDVNYILEGSGHRDGNKVRLIVQLLDARKDKHLWSKTYDRDLEEIFSMQSEIAKLVAFEVEAIITPEERNLIESTPTYSLTAYDLYQRGREDLWKYIMNHDSTDLIRAEDYFHEALKYDSTFAQAYAWLARVYIYKNYWNEYFSGSFLDSVNIYAGIGLSFDNKLADAYSVRGDYFYEYGKIEDAINEYEKAIKFNPNDYMPYFGLGQLYSNFNLVKSIINYQKASQLNRGEQLPLIFRNIGYTYFCAGFPDKEKFYLQEALKLDRDSLSYYGAMFTHELWLGNYKNAIDFGAKVYLKDSSNLFILGTFGQVYALLGEYKMSSMYYYKWLEGLKSTKNLNVIGMYRAGFAFWQNGNKEDAEYCLNAQIDYCNSMNDLGRLNAELLYTYFDLAGTYSILGENKKAFENLRLFNQKQFIPSYIIFYLKNDPIFDPIRNKSEFQQIVRDVEAKYQAEHERVKKWLEEQGMLN